MTKQEIEQAIENGKSVWLAHKNRLFELCPDMSVKLNNSDKPDFAMTKFEFDNGGIVIKGKTQWTDLFFHYDDISKNKAVAEHYAFHKNVTRTETLPFLTWEDIEIQMKKMESFGLNRNDRVLARIITKDSIYYFKLCKDFDLFTFQLKQTYIGEDLCEQIRDKFPVSLGEATEENFYKAYDECVRRFRGEE